MWFLVQKLCTGWEELLFCMFTFVSTYSVHIIVSCKCASAYIQVTAWQFTRQQLESYKHVLTDWEDSAQDCSWSHTNMSWQIERTVHKTAVGVIRTCLDRLRGQCTRLQLESYEHVLTDWEDSSQDCSWSHTNMSWQIERTVHKTAGILAPALEQLALLFWLKVNMQLLAMTVQGTWLYGE